MAMEEKDCKEHTREPFWSEMEHCRQTWLEQGTAMTNESEAYWAQGEAARRGSMGLSVEPVDI